MIITTKKVLFDLYFIIAWNLTSLFVLRNMAWQVYSYPEYGEIKVSFIIHTFLTPALQTY